MLFLLLNGIVVSVALLVGQVDFLIVVPVVVVVLVVVVFVVSAAADVIARYTLVGTFLQFCFMRLIMSSALLMISEFLSLGLALPWVDC